MNDPPPEPVPSHPGTAPGLHVGRAEVTFEDLLAASERFASTYGHARLSAEPARRIAVVTCMDCRFDPLSCFGLEPGDVHIIRNAGARVTEDVLRSLIISTVHLNVKRVAVVHHTQCASQTLSVTEMADAVLRRTGSDPAGVDFMLHRDGRHTLRGDVARVASFPYIPAGVQVAGFVFEVETGRVRQETDTATVR